MNIILRWMDKVGVAGSLVALACCLGLAASSVWDMLIHKRHVHGE